MKRIGRRVSAAGAAWGAVAVGLVSTVCAAQVEVRQVQPQLTDPLITDPLHGHIVAVDPTAHDAGLLYVHLPGSCGRPANSIQILRTAAGMGWHAVGLSYPNCPSVGSLTQGTTDPMLHESIRRERLYGLDLTPLIEVNRPNCVHNRLIKLLQSLHDRFPAEGWDHFLSGDSIRWDRIVIGGHSQGSGHSALLGKDWALAGVVMFAGSGERFDNGSPVGAPVSWSLLPVNTAPGRMFTFVHDRDGASGRSQANALVFGMGAFGAPVSVDSVAPPYDNSRVLTTNAQPGEPGAFHACVVVDDSLALLPGGEILYQPVWQTMLNTIADLNACLPNCDAGSGPGSEVLDIFDFLCFQNRFVAGESYACNCDVTTGPDVCDVFDFLCFQNAFVAGCP